VIVTAEVDYEIDEEVVLTVQDSHVSGNCNKGARALFRRRGWDWSRFVAEGMRVGDLDVFDEHARRAYESALRRRGG
jgi:hypothetical protein